MSRIGLIMFAAIGALLFAGSPVGADEFYADIRLGNSRRPSRYDVGYWHYDGRWDYNRNYFRHLERRFQDYSDWFHQQSDWFQRRHWSTYRRGREIYREMYYSGSTRAARRLEDFLQRYYDPYAYSFDWDDWRYRDDPWRYRPRWRDDDYYFFPRDQYYDDWGRRTYYREPYYYREGRTYAYNTGHSIGHVVRGSNRDNDLEIASGILGTVGSVLGMINNEREEDDRRRRYYRR